MDKTFCDKCGKEIVGKFYVVQFYLENAKDEDKEEPLGSMDICPDCYDEIGLNKLQKNG